MKVNYHHHKKRGDGSELLVKAVWQGQSMPLWQLKVIVKECIQSSWVKMGSPEKLRIWLRQPLKKLHHCTSHQTWLRAWPLWGLSHRKGKAQSLLCKNQMTLITILRTSQFGLILLGSLTARSLSLCMAIHPAKPGYMREMNQLERIHTVLRDPTNALEVESNWLLFYSHHSIRLSLSTKSFNYSLSVCTWCWFKLGSFPVIGPTRNASFVPYPVPQEEQELGGEAFSCMDYGGTFQWRTCFKPES